jgi:hypothetical protein
VIFLEALVNSAGSFSGTSCSNRRLTFYIPTISQIGVNIEEPAAAARSPKGNL